jgi:hypothetical protein
MMSRLQNLPIRLMLAVMLFLASGGAPGMTAGNAAGAAARLGSDTPNACPADACIYLPVLPYTPVPPVEIVEWELQRNYPGYCVARGEIGTTVGKPVYDVQIDVRIYDQNNQLAGIESGTPVFTATLPGQLNPFDIGTGVYCIYGEMHAEVTIRGWDLSNLVNYEPLSVDLSPKGEPGDLVYEVRARIQNDGPAPLENVRAVIWSLKQAYSINNVQKVADSMAPGEAITVTQNFYSWAVDVTGVRAAAQGVAPAQP